jgi:hypothetical protein
MSILKVNEVQVFNGNTITLTATTTAASGAVTVGGNLTVSGAISSSDASTTRTNLGLGTISTQAANSVDIDGGAIDGVTVGTTSAVTDLRVDNLQLDGNTISSTNTDGNITLDPNGTGNVSIGNFSFDADQTVGASQDNYVLTYDDATGLISLEASAGGGGGSGSSYIEHSSTVSDSLAITAGTNRMYVGNTSFSSGGVTMAGTLVVAGGYANFTNASALDITGTLNVI